jgi:hypothetical protein
MSKSVQVDPLEEAKSNPAKEAAAVHASEKSKVPVPTSPAADVPPPPSYRLDMPEKKLVGAGGKMTWVQPGMIVSERTHKKGFMEDLKSAGIKLVEVSEAELEKLREMKKKPAKK